MLLALNSACVCVCLCVCDREKVSKIRENDTTNINTKKFSRMCIVCTFTKSWELRNERKILSNMQTFEWHSKRLNVYLFEKCWICFLVCRAITSIAYLNLFIFVCCIAFYVCMYGILTIYCLEMGKSIYIFWSAHSLDYEWCLNCKRLWFWWIWLQDTILIDTKIMVWHFTYE